MWGVPGSGKSRQIEVTREVGSQYVRVREWEATARLGGSLWEGEGAFFSAAPWKSKSEKRSIPTHRRRAPPARLLRYLSGPSR